MPMHEDEVRATPELVEGLVAEQCPQWHGLPVTALPDDVEGTDNVLFRLGDALVVRMPKVEWAAQQADSDARWLPRLAPHLPVSVPVPVHLGRPSDDYPWAGSVVPWVDGATPPRLGSDDAPLARDVADFALRLREVDPAGGTTKPAGSRGTPLSTSTRRRAPASSGCAATTTASTSTPPSAPGTSASPLRTGTATPRGSTVTSSPATSSSTAAASSPSSTGAPSVSATRL